MIYTREQVRAIVAKARSNSTRQWVPGKETDPGAVQKVHSEFDQSLIAPEEGTIEIESHIASVLSVEAGPCTVWFVTAAETQRVFFDERSEKFGVAWGPDIATGRHVDLGFRTIDPIDAFLA